MVLQWICVSEPRIALFIWIEWLGCIKHVEDDICKIVYFDGWNLLKLVSFVENWGFLWYVLQLWLWLLVWNGFNVKWCSCKLYDMWNGILAWFALLKCKILRMSVCMCVSWNFGLLWVMGYGFGFSYSISKW